jgi:hypothetical protein
MTDRPIIFSGPMVRALLDGRKTQTRRLAWRDLPTTDGAYAGQITRRKPSPWQARKPDDRLWVREACFYANGSDSWVYRADGQELRDCIGTMNPERLRWIPAIHMPRKASRITLLVEAVCVERLQDISREDALAEGATSKPSCYGFGNRYEGWSMDWKEPAADWALCDPVSAFGSFINELHGGPHWNIKPGPDLWESNPWVVAVTFKVVRANIDSPEAKAE